MGEAGLIGHALVPGPSEWPLYGAAAGALPTAPRSSSRAQSSRGSRSSRSSSAGLAIRGAVQLESGRPTHCAPAVCSNEQDQESPNESPEH
jgi:hypothetical protein